MSGPRSPQAAAVTVKSATPIALRESSRTSRASSSTKGSSDSLFSLGGTGVASNEPSGISFSLFRSLFAAASDSSSPSQSPSSASYTASTATLIFRSESIHALLAGSTPWVGARALAFLIGPLLGDVFNLRALASALDDLDLGIREILPLVLLHLQSLPLAAVAAMLARPPAANALHRFFRDSLLTLEDALTSRRKAGGLIRPQEAETGVVKEGDVKGEDDNEDIYIEDSNEDDTEVGGASRPSKEAAAGEDQSASSSTKLDLLLARALGEAPGVWGRDAGAIPADAASASASACSFDLVASSLLADAWRACRGAEESSEEVPVPGASQRVLVAWALSSMVVDTLVAVGEQVACVRASFYSYTLLFSSWVRYSPL